MAPPMNTVQRILVGFMLLVAAGFVGYPEWRLAWTVEFDHVYYYDKDLTGPRPAAGLFQRGTDVVRHTASRRALLIPGPPRPLEAIPPPKAERTGTGTLDLGRRHTLYTDARVTDFTARVNGPAMARDLILLLIPTALFAVMFRNKREV